MISAASFPALQKAQDRGTHSFESGKENLKAWATRPNFGDPQSLNLYGFVRNDPVSRADLDGHQGPGISPEAQCSDPHGCNPELSNTNNHPDGNPIRVGQAQNSNVCYTDSCSPPPIPHGSCNAGTCAIAGDVGDSVKRGYKWYKFITGWFNKAMEAKKLKDEMQSDGQIRDIAAGAVMSMNPRTPAEFGEIWQLEEQNLLLDTGRQLGKLMGEVPNIPGEDKFGEAVFNAYGTQRDKNNKRIDTLLQEAADSLTSSQ